jgi:hypothetical protein
MKNKKKMFNWLRFTKFDKKGMVVAHLFDYVFIVFIAFFGFLFIYLNFVSSIENRNAQSLQSVEGITLIQDYILEHRAKFESGETVDIQKMLTDKIYLQKYRQLPEVPESVGLQEI